MADVSEYVKIRDLVHITRLVPNEYLPKELSFCGIDMEEEEGRPGVRSAENFDPCELCCECQAYEEASKKEFGNANTD